MAVLAAIVIFDGLTGPQISPMNLAGVLAVDSLARPVDLEFAGGRQFFLHGVSLHAAAHARPPLAASGGRPWPHWFRSKWLAVGLIALFLWSYEAFSLWNSPWMTAWIAIGYFVAAFVVDSLFSGAAFCKYVCPIGQFNFVHSLVSPLEVKVREPTVCASCNTKECIRGSAHRTRLWTRSLPTAQARQSRLHVLPRLRPRLPAR